MSEIEAVETDGAEESSGQALHGNRALNKKSIKKLILVNGIAVGVLLAAGLIFVLITLRNAPVKALVAENQKLKTEIKNLQESSRATGNQSPEIQRVENLVSRLQPRLGSDLVAPIAAAVVEAANQYDLPPELILSIIYYESEFEVTAESEDGSAGLMQISPKVFRPRLAEMGIAEYEAFHISENINLGCLLLREFLNQGESIELAISKLVGNQSRVDEILVGFTNTMIAAPSTLGARNGESAAPAQDNEIQPAPQ